MAKFEGVQKLILEADNKTQLVSAGAGSGKTTVMIQKISEMILSGNVDVDNLLVVTFTVLAAEEMKQRLIAKLQEEYNSTSDKERVLNIIEKLKTASIDTIDGFASKTIKKYFYDLEISPNIEIISDNTRDYYLTKAMKKTIKDYTKSFDNLNILLDLFGGNKRSLDNVEELILNVYRNVINLKDVDEFLNMSMGEYVDAINSENIVNVHICSLANRIVKAIISECGEFTKPVQDKLKVCVDELSKFNINLTLKHNLQILFKFEGVNFSVKENKENENLKALNLKIKQLVELKQSLQENLIDENFEEKNEKIIKYFTIFINLLKNFIKNYDNLKKNNNLIDFNDLSRMMVKLLKNEKIKNELQQKYTHIFIDEYQDVNPLQDEIMSNLVGESNQLFMVGDVKQSIYGFRGSSPEWFLKKYNNLKSGKSKGGVFDMNVNFRSSPTVLNFINEIFSKIMVEETADINYSRDCFIEPKRTDIVDNKVYIKLFQDEKEDVVASGVYSVKNHSEQNQIRAKEKEVDYVVKTITELVGSEFYDANAKEVRKLCYSDIAILTRSEKDENAQMLIEELKNNAIPLSLTNKLDVESSEGLKLMLSILKCVNNTADDVDYLATFLALTNLTIDDVVELRNKEDSLKNNLINSDNVEVKKGFEILQKIKIDLYSSTNSELMRSILSEYNLKYYILRKPNGNRELATINEFINRISVVEDGLNLSEFIEMVESNVSKNGDFNSKDDENSVTIQTIHKSKGLEYPVVILFNASKIFSYLRDTDAISFNSDVGLGVDYFDTANRVKMDSLTKFAIKLKNCEKGYKEEMRLLYVALTRAKNKLFITGNYSDKIFSEEIKKNSYMNMILSCFEGRITEGVNEFSNCIIDFDCDYKNVCTEQNKEMKTVELIGENFEYPNQLKFDVPFKNSVTGINSQFAEKHKFDTKKFISTTMQYDYEDKAKVGTNYHKALEMLDYGKPYEKNTDLNDVDYSKIEQAHNAISKLTTNAINIKKEAEFMMYVPHNEVVESNLSDKVLIQGVVDLIIENENSIDIVDYKFSSLPAKILKEKYAEQLKLYKKAVESAFNKPVEHMYIYSINTNELI